MQTYQETLTGIIQRVTYHNNDTGWSVLKVQPFNKRQNLETVTLHQTKVFAGATMEFRGNWVTHPQHGRQFKAETAIEKKPATTAALEKYLGSGLIKGVGPKTAKKIVHHFSNKTLTVFEHEIERLTEVPGIASKKLAMIEDAWRQHRNIREVMMFLQSHGISTLFAVRIYRTYGDDAIPIVSQDPYRLSHDFYGIGFLSADKIALSIGLAPDSQQRIVAAIRHVLTAGREQGHCYLTRKQIEIEAQKLLNLNLSELLDTYLDKMDQDNHLKIRLLKNDQGQLQSCYYAKSLYYDEKTVSEKLAVMNRDVPVDAQRVADWIDRYCWLKKITLSAEQALSIRGIMQHNLSILTGGPGCGKTATTLVIVRLLEAMNKRVLLAAPTGRAAQRMSEVIGREAKTLHRLLGWQAGRFKKNEAKPLKADFLIIDECSMLDISLSASLLKAVPVNCQLLLIGDADQLPSVGAGNMLKDAIASGALPCFRLTQIFRQASKSHIIEYAHQINKGQLSAIDSPFQKPAIWKQGHDCLFIDTDEATREQLNFIIRAKRAFSLKANQLEKLTAGDNPYEFRTTEDITSPYDHSLRIPAKFQHVDLERLKLTNNHVDDLKAVLKSVHPWSSLHYGLSATDVIVNLYQNWIPKYRGQNTEIQILSPMTRGSMGTTSLNQLVQKTINPPEKGKRQLNIGERLFREEDRVIHQRNNYDLEVFNGDIGRIQSIDNENLTMIVVYPPNNREVEYRKEHLVELDLAYAITIHKSQGSEFETVIIPILSQHFMMLYRNLIYTGLTRARKLAVFVGTRQALAMAIQRQDTSRRQTALQHLLTNAD